MDVRQALVVLQKTQIEASNRVYALANEFEAIIEASTSANLDDEHDPEGPTVGFERARVAALRRDAIAAQTAIDFAMNKITDGRYGICESCTDVISPARLDALPTARLCIACATQTAAQARSRQKHDLRRKSLSDVDPLTRP